MKKLSDFSVVALIFNSFCNLFAITNKKSPQFIYARVPVSNRKFGVKR
jgi:hypothetical protein